MTVLPMHAWHPLLVHFPLVLLLGGAALEAAGWLMHRSALRRGGLGLMAAGVLFAIPAIATGLLAYGRVDHGEAAHRLMALHRNLALATVALFVAAVVWRWRGRERMATSAGGAAAYAILLAAASAGLIVVGYLGADLVFRHATGLSSADLKQILHEREGAHEHAAETSGGTSETPPGSSRPQPSLPPPAPVGAPPRASDSTAAPAAGDSPAEDTRPTEDGHHDETHPHVH